MPALLLDSLSMAFHAHVMHGYAEAPHEDKGAACRLAPWQLRRALDYIEPRLGASIADLARECRPALPP